MGGIKAYCSHNGANRRLLGTAQMEHGSTSVQEESTRWTIFAVFKIKKGNLGLFQGARLIPHAPKLLDHVFGAGKKFRLRNRYDHETDDSESYLVGIAMDFHRHRFRLSFWNTTRHS